MRNLGLNSLDIYITGQCNFQCEYCYGESDSRPAMTEGAYQAALSFASYIGANCVELCGGEPLVCPSFEDYVLLARKFGFGVILRTNGMLIRQRLNFIARNCEWVGVSIDGLPAENAAMRKSRLKLTPEEQFSIPLQAIFDLKSVNPALKIILASVASRKNCAALPRFAAFLTERRVPIDKWKVYEFIRDKFRSAVNYEEYEMTEREFEALCAQMPKDINGASVQMQSAHTERAAANCLIVYQNGDINLLGKHYGNVADTPFDDIIDKLLAEKALTAISDNKERTYGKTENLYA